MDISSRFSRFLATIRPSREQLEAANRQVAFLREQLTEYIAADQSYHLERIFRAGSSAKHTDLARRGKDTFDIDLGVYYRAQGHSEEQLKRLLPYTHELLRRIYPGKPAQDIHLGKNAINVTFRTSKLQVDVVPIVRDQSLKWRNSGWIPRQDQWRLTSITAHIHFVHARTACYKQVSNPVKFNHLVRLMKWWNRRLLPENLRQCSYFCELITAAALEKTGVTREWQSSLSQIFRFLARHAFAQPIVFRDYYDPKKIKYPDNPVIVLDAVNAANNVTSKWTMDTKQGYLTAIRETWDLIQRAQSYERAGREDAALEIWCQIFGDDFLRLS